MQAYRTSTKLKLGLIAAAVAISLASLLFTHRLADRLGVPRGQLDRSPVPDIALPFDGDVIRRLALMKGRQ